MFDNPSKYQYEDCCTHYNESGYDFGYGALKVSLNGMSVVIDDDCMGKRGWQEAYTEEKLQVPDSAA